MTSELEFTTVGDGKQRFRLADVGEGRPVVLFHGFPDTPQSWGPVAEQLVAAGHRVVVPYLRGYHRDTLVEGRGYGASELADDVVVLLDTLDLESAVLVGHDWGASCVWGAVELAPDRVEALAAVAIPHPSRLRLDLATAWGARHFATLKLPFADRLLAARGGRYVATLFDRWAPDWRSAERGAALARARALVSDPVLADHVVRWYGALRPGAARPAPFALPALLVAGERDITPVSSFNATTRLFADPEQVEVLTVAGAGHWPHREDEPAFVAALLRLLDRVP